MFNSIIVQWEGNAAMTFWCDVDVKIKCSLKLTFVWMNSAQDDPATCHNIRPL